MKSLTLEISIKPFFGLDREQMLNVCRSALSSWSALCDQTEELSILLWISDGSELLEYAGDLEAEMEWSRYVGNANPHMPVPNDPEGKSTHSRNYLYRDDATLITYRRLQEIVAVWREAAEDVCDNVRIGTTFDPGGEFAPSSFKYQRHREICLSNTMGRASFVCCYTHLHAESKAYAGYPDGIPEGESLGAFLGKQSRAFAQDLGFDFIWFSNGFGFGQETWKTIGPLFDGEQFMPERAPEIAEHILAFWKDFRRQCPELEIRTRGTNLGTGTDLASDATPLRELYAANLGFDPPPNSPWAAINGDFGIELAGYLSRIVETPPNRPITFRFYLHDPWWLNSPWIDRYEGQPHDVYLPLSAARIDDSGNTVTAERMALFTLDDSSGKMPEQVPEESIPHLKRAWRERPDAPGPLVWLYPFDELHDNLRSDAPTPERLFHTDWFARESLNHGCPLNTVVSTRSFDALGPKATEVFAGRILVTPAPFDQGGEQRILDWVAAGQKVIVYGTLREAREIRNLLGLVPAKGITGELLVETSEPDLDCFESETTRPRFFRHQSALSGGPLEEAPRQTGFGGVVAHQGIERRALSAAYANEEGGELHWLRAPLPLKVSTEAHLPVPEPPESTFPLAELARQALARCGWRITYRGSQRNQRRPVLTIHRHANGWYFSGYHPDTTIEVSLRTPWGAPLLLGQEVLLRNGNAHFHGPRAYRRECRIFIEQDAGVVSAVEDCPAQIGVHRRIKISGLKDAAIRFFPTPGSDPVTCWDNPAWPFITGRIVPLRTVETAHGILLETTRPASGNLLLSW